MYYYQSPNRNLLRHQTTHDGAAKRLEHEVMNGDSVWGLHFEVEEELVVTKLQNA